MHHNTVRRVLAQAGQAPGLVAVRPSMVDPFVPLIRATLEKYPTLRASRLYAMVRERGYTGGPDHFRHVVARYRPRPVAEAYLRLRTLPGEQAQVDWGYFGKLQVGRAERALWGFVMVLSYSRQIFLRFFFGNAMANFLRGHVAAFDSLQRRCRSVLLYDNLRAPCSSASGRPFTSTPRCSSWPRTTASSRARWRWRGGMRKGASKGQFATSATASLPPASLRDLADLNAQAAAWCAGIGGRAPVPRRSHPAVREVFADEQRAPAGAARQSVSL